MAQGSKTPPEIEEAVFAHYRVCLNYSEVSRKFKMPDATVWDIVQRLAGDELGELRKQIRARAYEQAMATALKATRTADQLLESTDDADVAARVAASASKVAYALKPDQEQATGGELVVRVHGVGPGGIWPAKNTGGPTEVAAEMAGAVPLTSTTTTTAKLTDDSGGS